MIQLETKSKKFTCPSCGAAKKFKRYANERGEYIADHVGICDRLNSCGYHYTPKMYFADNPHSENFQPKSKRTPSKQVQSTSVEVQAKAFDFIPFEQFKKTLGGYENNAFVKFLLDLFPGDGDIVQNALKMYFVGTYQDYICFPQIDGAKRICKAKLIRFNAATGRRLKGEYDTSSLVAKLKLKEDFNYRQTFFGEHLLREFPNKPAAIVESEKSAIIGSICFPEFVWLGSNSKTWLKPERLTRLGNRSVVLYPDADGFALWRQIAQDASARGLNVKVSALIETQATDAQKANGCDLADYLIAQQQSINEFNDYVDFFNAKLEMVMTNENLMHCFDEIIEERKAVMIVDGGLPESAAEIVVTQVDNIRQAVMSV